MHDREHFADRTHGHDIVARHVGRRDRRAQPVLQFPTKPHFGQRDEVWDDGRQIGAVEMRPDRRLQVGVGIERHYLPFRPLAESAAKRPLPYFLRPMYAAKAPGFVTPGRAASFVSSAWNRAPVPSFGFLACMCMWASGCPSLIAI